ncbi:MAG: hypothetical protein AAF478_04870 [Pseudomonadota bacterium]
MNTLTKTTAVILAASFAFAPISANAMGDNMFSWPTTWPQNEKVDVQGHDYGSSLNLKAIKLIKTKKSDKKKQ